MANKILTRTEAVPKLYSQACSNARRLRRPVAVLSIANARAALFVH
jgi:hypothetical protein